MVSDIDPLQCLPPSASNLAAHAGYCPERDVGENPLLSWKCPEIFFHVPPDFSDVFLLELVFHLPPEALLAFSDLVFKILLDFLQFLLVSRPESPLLLVQQGLQFWGDPRFIV